MSGTDSPLVVAIGPETISTVDIALCSLSLVGACIMFGTCLIKRLSSRPRQRLMIGLAVSDVLLALAILVPECWDRAHNKRIAYNSVGCNISAFMYLAAMQASNLWTLGIAVVTYIILVLPLSNAARRLETNSFYWILWFAIYVPSLAPSLGGVLRYNTVDFSGVCFFVSGRDLFAILVLFIPRFIVLVIVCLLYLRLFVFFRRKSRRASFPVTKRKPTQWLLCCLGRRRKTTPADWSDLDFSLDPPSHSWQPSDSTLDKNGNYHGSTVSLPDRPPQPVAPTALKPVFQPPPFRQPAALNVNALTSFMGLETRRGSLPSPLDTPMPLISVQEDPESCMNLYEVLQNPSAEYQLASAHRKGFLDDEAMNRRAAKLMLLYPASYLFLISASLARAIMDLSTCNSPRSHRPKNDSFIVLHAISRWLIFSSGIVDVIIFVVIERFYHRGTRKLAKRPA